MSNQVQEKKIAWFNRAKPLGKDALEIFQQASHVFIGYPLRKNGVRFDPHALLSCLVDPTCSAATWNRYCPSGQAGKMYNKNRNFIPCVTKGSIVAIPRTEEGAIYVGRINGPFKIVDSPNWGGDYRRLRESQGCEWRYDDIAQVAQGWSVNEYKRFPLLLLPVWMHQSIIGLRGQGTFDKFGDNPIDNNTTAWGVLDQILKGDYKFPNKFPPSSWTLDIAEIKRRLVDTMTPYAFENLVVSLLQLEDQNEIWYQTGGSGDGGIDGLGIDANGVVVGLMQAKLYYSSPLNLGKLNLGNLADKQKLRRYAAILVPEEPTRPTDGRTELLDMEWIASAVHRHWRKLPQACAMRVGKRSYWTR